MLDFMYRKAGRSPPRKYTRNHKSYDSVETFTFSQRDKFHEMLLNG